MKVRTIISLLSLASVMMLTTACSNAETGSSVSKTTNAASVSQTVSETQETSEIVTTEKETETSISETAGSEVSKTQTMIMKIGNKTVDVTWEDNASVEDLKKLAASGLTVKMSKYGGFEQVGSIGKKIASNDKQTKTAPGDIVLYTGNKLVVFYGTNSWEYTRLGKINMSKAELKELLGKGDVTVTLSME